MPAAMKQVREALGDNAIILSSQSHKGKKGVSVTAAVEQEDDELRSDEWPERKSSSTASNSQPATESLRFQIQETLRFHNIPELFIAKIMNADRGAWKANSRHCLEKLLAAYFRFEPLNFSSPLGGAPGEGGTAKESLRCTTLNSPFPKGGVLLCSLGRPALARR